MAYGPFNSRGDSTRFTLLGSQMDYNEQRAHPLNISTNKNTNVKDSFPSFGPCYIDTLSAMQNDKVLAMDHVMGSSFPFSPSVMRNTEQHTSSYADVENLSSDATLQELMINDGNLFIQLSIMILGGYKDLGYQSDKVFGKMPKKKEIRNWLESMFLVGNQIPWLVLKELLEQDFFKSIIVRQKWKPPSQSAFCKRVLYELLVGTERVDRGDILHRLNELVMGNELWDGESESDSESDTESVISTQIDTRTNGKRPVKDQANTVDESVASSSGKISGNHQVGNIDDPGVIIRAFPSASDLLQSGIRIKVLRHGGASRVCFKNCFLWGNLYLPVLGIEDDVQMIFRNCQELDGGNRKGEVNSYLRLMSDLAQSSKDVKILRRFGMISGCSHDEDRLHLTLSELCNQKRRLTDGFNSLKRQIRDFSGPSWDGVQFHVMHSAVLLTFLQTVYTVLSYYTTY